MVPISRTSLRSIEPKGIEDYLKDLCLIYRGEIDNPHDVNDMPDEELEIQFLKYNLWDVERSIMETPGILCTSIYLLIRIYCTQY